MALTKGQIGIIQNWLERFNTEPKCAICGTSIGPLKYIVGGKVEECKMHIAGQDLTQISITCDICGHIILFDTRKIIL